MELFGRCFVTPRSCTLSSISIGSALSYNKVFNEIRLFQELEDSIKMKTFLGIDGEYDSWDHRELSM